MENEATTGILWSCATAGPQKAAAAALARKTRRDGIAGVPDAGAEYVTL
jgi:hypothetical protein